MNQELDNIFNSAKKAMADDLRLNYYNAAQERNFYFRQLNNKANSKKTKRRGISKWLTSKTLMPKQTTITT